MWAAADMDDELNPKHEHPQVVEFIYGANQSLKSLIGSWNF
jgi:hypothetical protein